MVTGLVDDSVQIAEMAVLTANAGADRVMPGNVDEVPLPNTLQGK